MTRRTGCVNHARLGLWAFYYPQVYVLLMPGAPLEDFDIYGNKLFDYVSQC